MALSFFNMRISKYLLLFAALLCFNTLLAQTFTVTSNADSGPGTLRDGLTQAAIANRTTPFTINFQLPGNPSDNANRTIRLRTALPIITSNVIIDGSSQTAWPALGVSGAKVILEPEYPNSTFSGLVIGQYSSTSIQTSGVEIYGLYIRNFASFTNLQNVNTAQGSGIVIDYRASDITIGKPGKGNVIGGNINGILIQNSYYYNNNTAAKIKIQSNLIGVIYDGITANTNVTGLSASLYDCSLDLGGDNAGESNVIAANKINVDIKRYYSSTTRFDINIINNKIGVDYTGIKDFHELPIFLSSSSLELAGIKVDASNSALYIRNNVVGGNRTVGISIANADFILTGNSVGASANGSIPMGNGIGIKIETNGGGTIGGATTAETNIIANNTYGIETVSTRPVKITRNSMFCNSKFGIGKTLSILQPYIQILKKRANYVAGRATPNSEVELFFSQRCGDLCEGKTYIATVQAGSDGRWEYNGAVAGSVVATASLLNATTSPFSTADLLPNEAIVEPVTCNSNGSITIAEPREGFTFDWVKIETDGSRVPKGSTQSISGLDVGTYEVTIDDGCKPFSTVFIIKDQKLTKPTINAPTPICGQTSFSFSAEVLRGKGVISYSWINTATNAVVSATNPANLPEGNYLVRVKDEAGCTLDSDPVDIRRKPKPIITSTTTPISATCGQNNGAVKGLRITDVTGIATYKWVKNDPLTGIPGTATISIDLDLENVESGAYTLYVSDQGQCSPNVSQTFYVGIINNIAISDAGLNTPTTCDNNNGVLDFISIANADTYEWFGPNGASLKKGTYSSGTSLRIANLAPGSYRLQATNSLSSCAPVSKSFVVLATPKTIYTYTATPNNTTCELINGSILINFSSVLPSRFEWRDESGNLVSGSTRTATSIQLKNIPAGNYKMYAYDINGCETIFGPYSINVTPKLSIVARTGTSVDDGCTLQRGSIKGVTVVGGIPPYDFKWLNEAGETVQSTQDLINVGAGIYRLKVTDKTECGVALSEEYTVADKPFKLATPVANDIRVCYVSDITIPIIAPEEGTYQLFESPTDVAPLYESNKGIFNFKVSKTADYYIRRKLGSCTSEFKKIHIEVTFDNLEITNIMTPNGDGLNDYWMVRGLPDYKGNSIKVYTRGGQLIYESIGNYTKPFDGRFRGEELPAGVYYYVIDLRSECKPLGGSITLLR